MGKHRIFRIFLVIYACFMLLHALHLEWNSWIVPASLFVGFTFAMAAHSRHGVTTYLLVLHMSLEWMAHGRHGFQYPPGEAILHGIHACLDIGLLYHAIHEHVRTARMRKMILSGIIVGLGLMSISCYQAASDNHPTSELIEESHGHSHHSEGGIPVEPFLVGGIFGCIFYHLRKRVHITERS